MINIRDSVISTEQKHISAIADALKENARALRELAKAAKKSTNSTSYGIYIESNNINE